MNSPFFSLTRFPKYMRLQIFDGFRNQWIHTYFPLHNELFISSKKQNFFLCFLQTCVLFTFTNWECAPAFSHCVARSARRHNSKFSKTKQTLLSFESSFWKWEQDLQNFSVIFCDFKGKRKVPIFVYLRRRSIDAWSASGKMKISFIFSLKSTFYVKCSVKRNDGNVAMVFFVNSMINFTIRRLKRSY